MPVTQVEKDVDALTMTITAEFDDEGKPVDGGPTAMTVTIAEADGTATMSVQTHFANRESMEQTIEMGFEQGLTEMLNQLDPFLGAARA